MTLVVGEATAQGPRLVSDTKVHFPGATHVGYDRGALKIVLLNPELAVGFAGDVAIALDAVRQIHVRQLYGARNVPQVLHLLEEASIGGRREAEFLVATGERSLARVRAGRSEAGLDDAWIGDAHAFSRFQEARLAPDPVWASLTSDLDLAPGTERMATLSRAMHSVIDSDDVDSVGDFCVAVTYGDRGFSYLESTFVYVGRDFVVDQHRDVIGQMAQSVEDGGFSVSVVEPANTGVAALGLSFPQARLAMMLLPLEFDEVQVLRDVGPNEFADAVRDRFDVEMKPPMLRHT
jgi:hypothetical protein